MFVQTGYKADLVDLPTNSKLFNRKVLPIIYQNSGKLSTSERQTCKEFFKNFTLTDDERKLVWKTRIGN
jgi:hypothetical protein